MIYKLFALLIALNLLTGAGHVFAGELAVTSWSDEEILIEKSRQKECLKKLVAVVSDKFLDNGEWLSNFTKETPMRARGFSVTDVFTHAGYSVDVDKDEFSISMGLTF
ncbi:MAG: hypothetical protein H7A00_07865 [Hahellaceae bacterium]|nr:hypothetical protein [Hahellaceae bacterium]